MGSANMATAGPAGESSPARAVPPLEARQVHVPAGVEPHAFALQEEALADGAGDVPETDATRGVQDAMPGDGGVRGERVERVPRLAGSVGQAGEARDLPVGGDAAAGHAAHHRVDAPPRRGAGHERAR
jgi:hypothetical protein